MLNKQATQLIANALRKSQATKAPSVVFTPAMKKKLARVLDRLDAAIAADDMAEAQKCVNESCRIAKLKP